MRSTILLGPTPEAGLRLQLCRLVELEAWDLPNLSAPFWRGYCPFAAGGFVTLGERELPLRPGRLILIPPDTPFRSHLSRPFRKAYAHFSWQARALRPRPGLYELPLSEDERRRLRRIEREFDAPDADKQLTLAMLGIVAGGVARLPAAAWRPTQDLSRWTEAALDLMSEHLARPLLNAELAVRIGLSENLFLRRFTREFGAAPQKHYLRLRLERACDLLVGSNQSLEQIAAACGFCDRHHLTRTFTRQWGLPPARFRRINNPL